MTIGGYGPMRATDADRDSVHGMLQAAYADGRLTWDEFEVRSASLMQAKTFDELRALTQDLQQPVPYRPGSSVVARQGTNGLSVVSLGFGVGQFLLPFFGGIVAIITGHIARRQIRETGETGDGMAIAGLVMGYIGVIVPLLALLAIIFAVASSG